MREKWEQYYQKNRKPGAARQATIVLTVENVLALLGEQKNGRMLDIGCGFGEITILLAKNTNFEITGFDISEKAVAIAKENVRKAGLESRIKIEEGDVYNLKYPDNYFDVVVSFGYVSAATYPGVQKEIARVLKPDGILICDFINCLSFYKVLNTIKRVLMGKKTPYYINLAGIRREFEKSNLVFKDQCFFNTYPPLNLNLSPKIFLVFENTVGRLLKNFLGRVRLVCFSSTLK